MATDQPTPPDLGNISQAAFLALPDWSVIATNVVGKDDTFGSMDDCVVSLLYRLIRDNFDYLNEALACRVDTPLSLAAKQALSETVHWRETDWPALGLTLSNMVGVSPLPTILFSCNGSKLDDVSGTLSLNPPSPGSSLVYAVVNAQGSKIPSSYPIIYGLRNHAERWIYADDTAAVREVLVAYQATYSLPEWPQDTVLPIVLAKVADFLTAVDVGPTNRIGFEFGLGPAPVADANSNARDYVLYVRWYDGSDVEVLVHALLPTGFPGDFAEAEPIAITPGRRITLGFQRYFVDEAFGVRFYVNGREVARTEGLNLPNIAPESDLRLHIGSAQLGKSYTGGPINNVLFWANPGDADTFEPALLTAYLRGEGFELPP